jgi:HEAT repeat protein
VKKLIGSVYGLEDLSARPLLLRMIVDSYVELYHKKFREVSLWDLYDVYTKNIFTRRRLQTGALEDNLSEASKIIALHLFRTKKIWIDWSSLQNILKHNYLSKSRKKYPESDLSNAPSDLLLHREGDLFRFSHLSLYDFFLAQALIDEIEAHRLNILSDGALTPETLSFVFSAIRNNRRRLDWKWLVNSFNRRPATGRRCWVIINLLSLSAGLRHDLLRKILPKALNSKDPEVLKKGLKIVGYFDCNGNHKSILRLLNSKDLEIKYLAIEAAGLHRISEASPIIIENINTTDQNIRGVSLWSLSKIRDERAAGAAIDLLQTKNKAFLRAATGILGKRQEEAALPFLRSLLKKGLTAWDRYYIEEAIIAITEKRKFDLSELSSHIRTEPQRWLKFLKSCKRNWLKRYLIDEIGEQRLREYAEGLKEIYDREEPHIRHTIIDAIGEMRSDENSQFLIEKFRAERNPIIRADIIWALGNGTDPRSLQIILQGVNDPSPLVQKWAQWAQTQYTRMDAASNMALRYMYPRQ